MTEAFANAENVVISGGTFTMVNGQRREELEERRAMKQLYSYASPDGFHNSQMRSREVDNQSVRELARRWEDLSCFAESFAVGDVLRDIFTWVPDPPIIRFPSMWVNGNNRRQTALIAQAVADILSKRGELSASFFFPQATGSSRRVGASVIPSIAYQLAEKIVPARSQILYAIINDPSIFDSGLKVQAQMKKLIIDPLWKASKPHAISHSNLILIHALEDCEDGDNFQESLLDAFAHALELLKHKFPLKLLVFGRHTTHLNRCFARLAGRSMVLQRPINFGHWLRVQEEIYQKEIALRKSEEELEQRRKQVEKMEEELTERLNQREHQLKEREYISVGDNGTGLGLSGMGGPPRLPPDSLLKSTLSMQLDKFPYAGNSMPNSSSISSMPLVARRAIIDRLPLHTRNSNFTNKHPTTGQPKFPRRPYSFLTLSSGSSNSGSYQTSPEIAIEHISAQTADSHVIPTLPSSPVIQALTEDAEGYYTAPENPIKHNGRTPLQTMDSGGISTLPTLSAIQAAVEDPGCTWKTDDNGVVVAGTLEGLVQFLVITIASEKHKDYHDIFSIACAEVTTPDKLFQIIARRLKDGVGQHNVFLVIEHWLKLGYIPSNQSLQWTVKSLCEHAIQSKSESARLYGFTNLQQLIDQGGIMGHSAPPSPIGQGCIPPADLDPHSLAIALSLLEGENYQALRPSDYVLHLTKNGSKNVNKFYETNDKTKLWVIESILQYDDVHRRAEVMAYFIKTALECRGMWNLSSAIAIISALYSTAIQRLEVTRKSLTRDKQVKLSTLYHIVNPDSEYRGYWDTLKGAPTAKMMGICIPWLRVHLNELQKVLYEHPVTIQEEGQHLINLERYMAFMARSTELLHYTFPSVGHHDQGEQFKNLLAQLRTVRYPPGTDERLLARSATLQDQEVSKRRSRLGRDQKLQLGFQS